ncbi:UNVERIFIED_CONTAM: hypothetical protein HDU68_005908, partial [Siphonaria sp. JEL0065]
MSGVEIYQLDESKTSWLAGATDGLLLMHQKEARDAGWVQRFVRVVWANNSRWILQVNTLNFTHLASEFGLALVLFDSRTPNVKYSTVLDSGYHKNLLQSLQLNKCTVRPPAPEAAGDANQPLQNPATLDIDIVIDRGSQNEFVYEDEYPLAPELLSADATRQQMRFMCAIMRLVIEAKSKAVLAKGLVLPTDSLPSLTPSAGPLPLPNNVIGYDANGNAIYGEPDFDSDDDSPAAILHRKNTIAQAQANAANPNNAAQKLDKNGVPIPSSAVQGPVVLDKNGVPIPNQPGSLAPGVGGAVNPVSAVPSSIAADDALLQKIVVAQNTILIGRDNAGKNTLIHNILGPSVRKVEELEENLAQYSNDEGTAIWKYELSSSENGGWSMNALRPIMEKGGSFQIVVVVQVNPNGSVDVAPISAVLYGFKLMGYKLSYGIIINGYASNNLRDEFPELSSVAAREWHYVPSIFPLPLTEGLKTLKSAQTTKVNGLWNFFESFRISFAQQLIESGEGGVFIPQTG